ncbi:MAG TPA: hypothetical protein VF741_08370, partial [Candidatus Aquilonibacter sp.]
MRLHILIFGLAVALVASAAAPAPSTPESRAFDYEFGVWNVHVSRLVSASSRTADWVTYDGTHTVTPLWDGRANIGVLEIRGATGTIEGLQLRLYDP